MQSVVVSSKHELNLVERLDFLRLTRRDDGSFFVEDEHDHAYIHPSEPLQDVLEPEVLDSIRARIENPIFTLIDYQNINFCKRILLAVADDPAVLVDDDHGVILPGNEFAERIRAFPSWDWRRRTD